MALASAQARDAVASLLATVAATGGRVFTSRTWPLAEADLPAWRVLLQLEDVERTTVHWPQTQQHTVLIEAAATVRATADLDDELDELCAAGLAALFTAQPPYGLALQGMDRAMHPDGEAAIGTATLRLVATFTTAANAPETITSA